MDFRIEHYSSGQPKSFESDLLLHDSELDEPLAATIAVNHPLIYRGYSIYQASFSDGGSELALRVWPLLTEKSLPGDINSAVFEELDIDTSQGVLRLELTNFRLFNINPVQEEGEEKAFRNYGPNFSFKLRNAQGEAVEYENYMLPVDIDERQYYLSGVRLTPNEPFQYLYIPVGPDGGIERFMQFNAMLRDPLRIQHVADTTAKQSMSAAQLDEPGFMEQVTDSMQELLVLFAASGFDGVVQQVESTVPEAERENVLDAYLKVLQTMLASIYAELLQENGVDLSQGITDQDSYFFDDATNAIGAIGNYGAPVYIELKTFEHIQSTGLQITRAPGKALVYFGFALLIAGVFCMFYVAARRVWFWIDSDAGQTRLLLAGSGLRHQRDFETEFTRLQAIIDDQFRKL
jgi:cytochrome c biogenesis protein